MLILLGCGFFLASCSAAKPIKTNSRGVSTIKKEETNRNLKSELGNRNESRLVSNILSNAENYLGVPYKFGGTASSGMDCSGLVVKVFEENNLKITRRTEEQAKEGVNIHIREVKLGDLLFFATMGGDRVSHVGIVHTIENSGEIKFIHASTRRGVIISSLDEVYWNKAFLFAKRVI